jgi:hypothetical protein
VRPNIQNVLKELNLLIHVIRFHVKSHLDNVSGVRIPKRSWIEAALADMKKQGAQIVEGIKVTEIDEISASALKAFLALLTCGAACGAVCCASASDTVSAVGSTARLNVASPRKENGFRREIKSDDHMEGTPQSVGFPQKSGSRKISLIRERA